MTWAPKPLGEILEQSGYHRAGDREFPVLSITMKQGLVDQADKFKKRIASTDTSNYRVVYKNELVVGFPIDEGVLGFQTKYPAGIVSPAYDIWKLKSKAESHIPYLERYLRSPQARRLYASRMQGAVARRRSLTKSDFLKLEVPFPPIDDQIHIAHLLGKVEGLIAQRKQHLQQLNDLLKSVFLEMFGDPTKNKKKWGQEYLGKLTSEKIGYGIVQPGNPVDDGVPTIRVGDFSGTRINGDGLEKVSVEISKKHKSSILKGDEILLACVGATIGKAAVVEPIHAGYNIVRATARIRASQSVNRLFLLHFLLSDFAKNYYIKVTRAVGQPTLNIKQIEELPVITPPNDLQNRFADVVEKTEILKSHYQQSLTDLEALYGALSQQAFKGELDLSRVSQGVQPATGAQGR